MKEKARDAFFTKAHLSEIAFCSRAMEGAVPFGTMILKPVKRKTLLPASLREERCASC